MPYGRQAGACSLKVPVELANPQGEWIEGKIEVPTRLVRSKPDTNERHEFDRLVRDNLARWTDWRAKKGWHLASVPKVRGPFDPPTQRTGEEAPEDVKWYFAIARFRRSELLWVGLDDVLETQDAMKRFGLVPEKDPLPWNDTSGTYDSGWVDPLKEAQESREKLGVSLSEYRIPEWWAASAEGRKWEPK